jgi:hypothetical protein
MALAIGVHLGLELSLPEVRFVAVDVLRRDIVGEMLISGVSRCVTVSLGFVAWLSTGLAGPDGPSTVGMARNPIFADSVVPSDLGTAHTVQRFVDILGVRHRRIPLHDPGYDPVLLGGGLNLVLQRLELVPRRDRLSILAIESRLTLPIPVRLVDSGLEALSPLDSSRLASDGRSGHPSGGRRRRNR